MKNKLDCSDLREKIVELDVDDDYMEVRNKIEALYKKLKNIGGFEFLRVNRSSRALLPILATNKGFDAKTLKLAVAKGRLYLRLYQVKLELASDHVNLDCMPEEKCIICEEIFIYIY